MRKSFLTKGMLAYFIEEARDLAEGGEIIEGMFFPLKGSWTGSFVAYNGDSYFIEDGYERKEAIK